MGKKAASHVDWAISMGIFLLYVLSMFIMIQPGIQPLQQSSNLVTVVEDGLKTDLYYNITKIPIYIEMKDVEGATIDAGKTVRISPLPVSGTNADFNVTFRPPLTPQTETSVMFDISVNELKFATPVAMSRGQTYVFWLYYSPNKYRTFPPPGPPVGEGLYDYTYGAPEKISGIDSAKLASFTINKCADTTKYAALKDKWAFPSGKDFSIYYVPSGKVPYDLNTDKIDLCNKAQPYDQSDLYVKEWSDWILNTDGTLKPTVINVKIW